MSGGADRRSSASWAPARRPPPARWPARSASSTSTPTRCCASASGGRSRSSSTRDGEAAFRAAEEEVVARAAGARRAAPVISLGGGAVLSERVRAALAATRSCCSRSTPTTAWRRARAARAARWRATAPRSTRCYARARAALRARWPTRSCRRPTARVAVRADAALRALDAAPAGTRLVWASAASGEYPVFVGRGVLGGCARPACAGARLRASPTARGRAPPGRAGRRRRASIAMPPGEEHKTLADRRARLARAGRARASTRADHVVALGGGVVGDLAGFCAAVLPARHPRRAGADDARRPGRLGLRRQDRRRPARGQELRRRLPPARRRAGRPRDARPRCRPRSSPPATPRWSRPR